MTRLIRSQGANIPAKDVYREMTAHASRKTNITVTTAKAFFIGGSICLTGEVIRQMLLHAGLTQDDAGTWTSVTLVLISALLTGTGLYQKFAKHGGAGTLVPVTGFANAVASAAIESRTEGYVLGVGTKIFTIAGPVLLYGTAASAVYGLLYYLFAA